MMGVNEFSNLIFPANCIVTVPLSQVLKPAGCCGRALEGQLFGGALKGSAVLICWEFK